MASTIRDRQDFNRKIEEAGEKLVVIDFFAHWCGPCKMISPKLEELARQYAEKAAVFKVDVETCEDLANEYNITMMPTFVFMKNKNILEVFAGGNTEKLVESLKRFIDDGAAVVDDGSVLSVEPNSEVTAAGAVTFEEPKPEPIANVVEGKASTNLVAAQTEPSTIQNEPKEAEKPADTTKEDEKRKVAKPPVSRKRSPSPSPKATKTSGKELKATKSNTKNVK